ncbi:MAG: hypothetical protein NDJ90_03480 [Oligoflexia bacterium]|nr:hypothetical protein [Oligoflexia bacterium]
MSSELRKKFVGFVLVALISGLGACARQSTGPDDPKKRLNEYISQSFSVKSAEDRAELTNYLTGQAKVRLTAWSDEQFRQAFIDSKRQFVKLVFTEVKQVSPTESNITYELTYIDQSRGNDAKVTNKKLCQMVKENGRWLVREVTNIKELVEYKNEMSLP